MEKLGKVMIPLSVIMIIAIGCKQFSGEVGDTETIFAATEVGTPDGEKIIKQIGPEGGELESPDGRVTLRVPKDALTETISFSVQPITNKASNGIGQAYRFEPDGKTFAKPLDIAVRFDDKDLEGTIPEALSIAYQDKQGAWRALRSARLDQAARTLPVLTTHFTDFAFLSRLRMNPTSATVYVGEEVSVGLIDCPQPGFTDRILSRPVTCSSAPKGAARWELRGQGSIEKNPHGTAVTYTAPAKKPTPNEAWVMLHVEFEAWDPDTGNVTKEQRTFAAKITILDFAYRATGQDLPTFYSSTVCSLDKSFTITGTNGPLTYDLKFEPSGDGRSGAGTMSGGYGGVTWKGSGTYRVEGFNSDKPRILFAIASSASIPQMGSSGSGTAHIDLVPLEGTECN